MFVNYIVKGSGYGHMCFRRGTSIWYIRDFLADIMLEKTSIIFARNFSKEPVKFIETYREGEYHLEKYDGFIRDVEELNDVYTYLYDKYGFTNILGYQ